ncbi:hypothetical protein QBC39DRAFT_178908 [Podospora conica]|nr:hypothetical protein QBC39DRAFT_178908 [Schizothecium conicum]
MQLDTPTRSNARPQKLLPARERGLCCVRGISSFHDILGVHHCVQTSAQSLDLSTSRPRTSSIKPPRRSPKTTIAPRHSLSLSTSRPRASSTKPPRWSPKTIIAPRHPLVLDASPQHTFASFQYLSGVRVEIPDGKINSSLHEALVRADIASSPHASEPGRQDCRRTEHADRTHQQGSCRPLLPPSPLTHFRVQSSAAQRPRLLSAEAPQTRRRRTHRRQPGTPGAPNK